MLPNVPPLRLGARELPCKNSFMKEMIRFGLVWRQRIMLLLAIQMIIGSLFDLTRLVSIFSVPYAFERGRGQYPYPQAELANSGPDQRYIVTMGPGTLSAKPHLFLVMPFSAVVGKNWIIVLTPFSDQEWLHAKPKLTKPNLVIKMKSFTTAIRSIIDR